MSEISFQTGDKIRVIDEKHEHFDSVGQILKGISPRVFKVKIFHCSCKIIIADTQIEHYKE